MEYKVGCALAIVLILGLSSSAHGNTGAQCAVPIKERVNCAPPDVSQADCNKKGCCFDSSVPNVIWCFHPKPEDECFV
ncbi:trefoil factor 3-like [Ascaphus truei]|uniref:trefoil factor 3-like n=1 Tax=Ascaphus truei TaxID=8439 RepID=UPI003F59294F